MAAPLPLLLGTNEEEARFFVFGTGADPSDEDVAARVAAQTNTMFRAPLAAVARERAAHSRPTFLYRFAYPSPLFGGAAHTTELPFIFGTYDEPSIARVTGADAEVKRVSAAVQDAWSSFAHTGDPSSAHVGDWPPCTDNALPAARFAADIDIVAFDATDLAVPARATS